MPKDHAKDNATDSAHDNDNPRLKKLRQQQEKIQKQIRLEKTRLNAQTRKDDTRRKILTGALVIEEAGSNPQLRAKLEKLLNDKLTRDSDRALFGLPPVKKAQKTPQALKAPAGKKRAAKK